MGKSLNDVLELIRDNGIRMVDFKLTDIDGRWRHLSIPAERLTEKTMTAGIGFDGSNYGFAPVENSDMVFVPVLDSAVIDTFAEIPTLSMIGDVKVICLPENKPFDQYPRNVAVRALEYMKETGVADEMIIGPEYEFYIFDEIYFENTSQNQSVNIFSSQAHWASVLMRQLVTAGDLKRVPRTENNPHGLLITNWRTLLNKDLEQKNKTIY